LAGQAGTLRGMGRGRRRYGDANETDKAEPAVVEEGKGGGHEEERWG